MTRLRLGGSSWVWRDDPLALPRRPSARNAWSHPGIAVVGSDVIVVHPAGHDILRVTADGAIASTWHPGILEAHGIAASLDGGVASAWVVDPGFGLRIERGRRRIPEGPPAVLRVSLDGEVLVRLEPPPIAYHTVHGAAYKPTAVAVADDALGGDGSVWVADGYGTSLVHRYARDGSYLGSISGEEGRAGAFRNTHALYVDTRGREPRLLVADRHNSRIQAYDLDGTFQGAFATDPLVSPSAFAVHGELLYVADLRSGIGLVDSDDRVVGVLGADPGITARPGWPNVLDAAGDLRRPTLAPGRFNSPHGLAVDAAGRIWVVEWVLGGRLVRLDPVTD